MIKRGEKVEREVDREDWERREKPREKEKREREGGERMERGGGGR